MFNEVEKKEQTICIKLIFKESKELYGKLHDEEDSFDGKIFLLFSQSNKNYMIAKVDWGWDEGYYFVDCDDETIDNDDFVWSHYAELPEQI